MSLLRFVFSKSFLKQVIFIALFFGLVFAGLYIYLQMYTSHDEIIPVPDVRGMSMDEVDAQLEGSSLGYEIIDSVYNEGEYGTILEQIPEPGSNVKAGRVLFLTVNASTEPMKIMNVKVGETLRIAATKLEILGLKYETIYKPDICNDCVLEVLYKGKEIKSGEKVRKGDKIVLVLGQRGDEKVLVPNLFGMTLDSARNVLTRSSLALGYPFYDEDVQSSEDTLSARIYSQRPGAKSQNELRIGSPVDIWLTTRPLSLDSLRSTKTTDKP